MALTRYRLKRAALAPHTAYKRRRARHLDHFGRSLLEAQYYRPAMYAFMDAIAANPELLVEADLGPESIVLDLGAYVGEWSEQISHRYGSRIYAFEPNPAPFERLQVRMAGFPQVACFEYGLAGADVEVALALEGPGSVVSDRPGTFGTADVALRDVAAVLEELQLREIDMCKCNIEGGEYDVFDRLMAVDRLRDVRIISVQFHEWHPHAYRRRRAIRRALARTHDEVWNYPFVWELWRRRETTP
jgi:FkbM family methyltransferase